MIRLALAFVLTLAPPAGASALLATMHGVPASVTTTNPAKSYLLVRDVSFELGFDHDLLNDLCVAPHVGCDTIPLAAVVAGATFDFNSGSPHFAEVTAKLTDGADELLVSSVRLFAEAAALFFTYGDGCLESCQGIGTPDLRGYTIDLIRVRVVRFNLGAPASGPGLTVSSQIDWEFYGVRGSVATLRTTWGRLKLLYR